jgi:hypothetical protein
MVKNIENFDKSIKKEYPQNIKELIENIFSLLTRYNDSKDECLSKDIWEKIDCGINLSVKRIITSFKKDFNLPEFRRKGDWKFMYDDLIKVVEENECAVSKKNKPPKNKFIEQQIKQPLEIRKQDFEKRLMILKTGIQENDCIMTLINQLKEDFYIAQSNNDDEKEKKAWQVLLALEKDIAK